MTRDTDTDLSINRRTLLKAGGATAIGLTAFPGTVSASAPEEIRFCGCSQVCVGFEEDKNSYRILYATETSDGYSCSLEPSISEAEPRTPDCFTVDPGEKIIGVLDGTRTLYLNPNTCAQRAIEALQDLNDCAGCTGDDGECISNIHTVDDYTKVGRHEYGAPDDVTIRTRLCKPPGKWKDDPNGPPSSGGPPNNGK